MLFQINISLIWIPFSVYADIICTRKDCLQESCIVKRLTSKCGAALVLATTGWLGLGYSKDIA